MPTWVKIALGATITSWLLLVVYVIASVWGAVLTEGYSDQTNAALNVTGLVWLALNVVGSIATAVAIDEFG